MTISMKVDKKQHLSLLESLELMTLPPATRFRIFKKTGQAIRKKARENIRAQKTVKGSPMKPRQDGKKRVLARMGRGLITQTTKNGVKVTWKQSLTAQIAYRHQHGIPESFTAAKMLKIFGRPDYKKPATRKQAKALIKEGFKVYAGKTGGGSSKSKRPSVRWIIENLNMGYAGLMLRNLISAEIKSRWQVKVPARPFLGVTDRESTKILQRIIKAEIKK